jgi:replicative DNA helicase
VVFITLETSPKWFVKQLLSLASEIPLHQMRNNEDIWENFSKIANTSRQLEKLPLYLCATECSVEGITTEIRKIRQQREIGCVIIDYLQLLSLDYPQKEDLTEIINEIKNMAVAFKVPVIVLTQLNRNLEKRADKVPLLCDIRGLYNNLNAVDRVLFLYREFYYIWLNEPKKRPKETDEKFQKRHKEWKNRCNETEYLCDIIIAKNSGGYCGVVKMFSEWWTGRFGDWKNGY